MTTEVYSHTSGSLYEEVIQYTYSQPTCSYTKLLYFLLAPASGPD